MQLTEYYRSYELPWEIDPEGDGRLRRLVSGALLLLLLFSVILPFIHLPKQTEAPEAVPERLAAADGGGEAQAAAGGRTAQAQARNQAGACP